MNIFKGGSCAGSSMAVGKIVSSASVAGHEAEGVSFWETGFEVFSISLKNGEEIKEERKLKA